jgi:hypothetical protein
MNDMIAEALAREVAYCISWISNSLHNSLD